MGVTPTKPGCVCLERVLSILKRLQSDATLVPPVISVDGRVVKIGHAEEVSLFGMSWRLRRGVYQQRHA
ncbi:hypothetical protein E2C01_043696 [Portunus trituberculatus]|uniref:Uncharacterized protein n=1 Tax=Portunus trituberculatus TaxID=210409 RepID=A0A5B7FQX5_PORTR|nr:hypothetical protein [Portunus trituberculatus]